MQRATRRRVVAGGEGGERRLVIGGLQKTLFDAVISFVGFGGRADVDKGDCGTNAIIVACR